MRVARARWLFHEGGREGWGGSDGEEKEFFAVSVMPHDYGDWIPRLRLADD
jgi:hypothetical protein